MAVSWWSYGPEYGGIGQHEDFRHSFNGAATCHVGTSHKTERFVHFEKHPTATVGGSILTSPFEIPTKGRGRGTKDVIIFCMLLDENVQEGSNIGGLYLVTLVKIVQDCWCDLWMFVIDISKPKRCFTAIV